MAQDGSRSLLIRFEELEPGHLAAALAAAVPLDIGDLVPLAKGMFSAAYACRAGNRHYVVRVARDDLDFSKDRYACEHFAGPAIPIPPILHHGLLADGLHYAVSPRCPGKTMEDDDPQVSRRTLPGLTAILDAMRCVDISETHGYGLLDRDGRGTDIGWREHLISLHNHKLPWERVDLRRADFWDDDLFNRLFEHMVRLTEFCPNGRWLVHGDFGFDNIIVDEAAVTGVLDWAECRYGDFLYDVAYLDFWDENIDFGAELLSHYNAAGVAVPHYEQRLRCYELYIGLGSLAIAALLHDRRDYVRVRERTLSVLTPPRRRPSDWTQ